MVPQFGLIIYMQADDLLDTSCNKYLRLLKKAINSYKATTKPPISLAMQCTKKWNGEEGLRTKRYFLASSGDFEGLQDVPHFNWEPVEGNQGPGILATLKDFLEGCKTRAMANQYVLILWGHGGVFFTFSGREDPNFQQLKSNILGAQFERNVAHAFLRTLKQNAAAATPNQPMAIGEDDFVFQNLETPSLLTRSLELRHFAGADAGEVAGFFPDKPFRVFGRTQKGRQMLSMLAGQLEDGALPLQQTTDNISITQLEVGEINEALGEKGFGGKIPLLVFNNCLMQSIENLYLLSSTVGYLVGSQDYLYRDEISLGNEVSHILEKGLHDIPSLCRSIVNNFPAIVNRKYAGNAWAYSATNAGSAAKFAINHLKPLFIQMKGNLNKLGPYIAAARACCFDLTDDNINETPKDLAIGMIDLYWFLINLQQLLSNAPESNGVLFASIRSKIQRCIDKLVFGPRDIVLHSMAGSSRVRPAIGVRGFGCSGVNIFFPANKAHWEQLKNNLVFRDYYREVDPKSPFYGVTKWTDFLNAYYA